MSAILFVSDHAHMSETELKDGDGFPLFCTLANAPQDEAAGHEDKSDGHPEMGRPALLESNHCQQHDSCCSYAYDSN